MIASVVIPSRIMIKEHGVLPRKSQPWPSIMYKCKCTLDVFYCICSNADSLYVMQNNLHTPKKFAKQLLYGPEFLPLLYPNMQNGFSAEQDAGSVAVAARSFHLFPYALATSNESSTFCIIVRCSQK